LRDSLRKHPIGSVRGHLANHPSDLIISRDGAVLQLAPLIECLYD
jgi:hypothetical protein